MPFWHSFLQHLATMFSLLSHRHHSRALQTNVSVSQPGLYPYTLSKALQMHTWGTSCTQPSSKPVPGLYQLTATRSCPGPSLSWIYARYLQREASIAPHSSSVHSDTPTPSTCLYQLLLISLPGVNHIWGLSDSANFSVIVGLS